MIGDIIQWRRGTAAAWTAANPILHGGEVGYETDTGKLKVGDGISDWTTLPYFDAGLTPVVPAALTRTDDTNLKLVLTGTPASALLQAVNIEIQWSGTLADGRIASSAYWNSKQDALGYTPVPDTRTVNGHALSSDVTVTKGDVGLGNVENTALSTWAGSNNIVTIGKIATYNGITTANNGTPISVGTPVHLTGQTSAIGATTFYTTDEDGFYTATVQLAVTTTGGTSIGCQIKFTNQADNVVKTMPSNNSNGLNQCSSASSTNAICYTITAYCKTGTAIKYVTNLSGSGQQYSLDAFVIKN